jgi:hypothetical protein
VASPPLTPAPERTSAQVRVEKGLTPWIALGFVASLGLVLTGVSVGSIPRPGNGSSWLGLPRGVSPSPALTVIFYASLLLMVAAWLAVGVEARRRTLTTRRATLILGVWGLPLFLGPPLFSRDLYSYIGQGLLAHHGFNPYTVGPVALGKGPLLWSVAQVWRATPAPYGPLFVTLSRGIAAVFGNGLVAEVLAFRALELIGVALMVYSLPRLARHLGADPGIALWLGVLSPLALYSFISSGHNDALMLGLLLAGVTLALEKRPMAGVVLCALATMIKIPAAAGIVFIAAHQLASGSGSKRWATLAKTVVVPLATIVAVTLASGLGWKWIGPSALHIPTELRTLATPTVSIGVLVFHVLRLVDLPVKQYPCVTVTQWVCGFAALGAVAWLLARAPRLDLVRTLGIALIVVVLSGPTLWPWYLTWGIALLAATPAQRSKTLAAGAALAMFTVGPSGTPLLGGIEYLPVALACLMAGVWLYRHGRWMAVVAPPRLVPSAS